MARAILMASGMGTRMRPLTDTIPKPLVEVKGKPMIETIMDGLLENGVDNFVVVVGYLGDQFSYLKDKYANVTIVRNEVYETVNNISSIYAAREYLKDTDCYICEADLFVSDVDVFSDKLEQSCYFGKYVAGFSSDWVFDQDSDGNITRVGKEGTDCYNMTGIAYLKATEANTLYNAIVQEYGKEGYEDLFWDDVVNMHLSELPLTVHPIGAKQIIEIDTVDELMEVRKMFS